GGNDWTDMRCERRPLIAAQPRKNFLKRLPRTERGEDGILSELLDVLGGAEVAVLLGLKEEIDRLRRVAFEQLVLRLVLEPVVGTGRFQASRIDGAEVEKFLAGRRLTGQLLGPLSGLRVVRRMRQRLESIHLKDAANGAIVQGESAVPVGQRL